MSVREIVFATNNAHKLDEIRAIMGKDWRVLSLRDIGCHEELPETSDTLEGNATQKAQYVHDHYGYNCFADDTGLFVDALGGAPGVYSARYAGEQCDSAANVAKLLAQMQGQQQRTASFRTVIAFVTDDGVSLSHGRVDGVIETECSGSDGFGYDPLFRPDGYDVTFAQMSAADKNAISHRRRAVDAFINSLKSN